MSNSFSEVTRDTWFGRLGKSVMGVIVGLVMFVVAFPLLWWNEGRALHTAVGLTQLQGEVVSTSADKVDPKCEGKPVHVTAQATSDATLKDPEFGISAQANKLRRRVEMYQWKEEKESHETKKVGGGSETTTTYTYNKVWSDAPIDSSEFKKSDQYVNPAWTYQPADEVAKPIKLGAFVLSDGLVGQLDNFEPLRVEQADFDKLPAELKEKFKLQDGLFYLGKDSQKPEIGDVRISFQQALPATVSIIAKQAGDTFSPWRSKQDTTAEWLMLGTLSAQDMISQKQSENTMLTWVLRLVGFVLMAIGLAVMLSPLAVLADVLPILGDFTRMGIALTSFLVALALSLVTIAAAWFFYRPLLSIGLLLVGAAAVVLWWKLMPRKRKEAPAAPQQA